MLVGGNTSRLMMTAAPGWRENAAMRAAVMAVTHSTGSRPVAADTP